MAGSRETPANKSRAALTGRIGGRATGKRAEDNVCTCRCPSFRARGKSGESDLRHRFNELLLQRGDR